MNNTTTAIDQDGFKLAVGVEEVSSASRGVLEVVIQREMDKVSRYFKCATQPSLSDMYNQAIDNNKVIMYSII
ncbi:hypothetical protein [Moritella sp. F3]|uniref:hypothetical protein n=1 Tax=Moritella sp. F3 TaxID=2718882 RepID=UPI0018E122C5|nr:hypothetical protein [Moritella sp. F3]GIC77175.1 hypothetical protein FMO001_19020 [Moritella sp. F1]GIC82294.1 hypothetical protein FMO003_25750 [Moritella sp. F3]